MNVPDVIEQKLLNGIILLNKPLGMSSNSALQKVKKLLNVKKAGHTGCLDPLATGMLPVCIGEATKFSKFLLDKDKSYRVSAKLGWTSTTGDAEGEKTLIGNHENITIETLSDVLSNWVGEINQVPPMFSAIKQNGIPLYKLARKGLTVERKSRPVFINSLNLVNYSDGIMTLDCSCSKGTYIRTLVEDIATSLGTSAYVTALHRLSVGSFHNKQMVTFDEIDKASFSIITLEEFFSKYNKISLNTDQVTRFINGVKLELSVSHSDHDTIVVYHDAKCFVGVGSVQSGQLIAQRLVSRNCLSGLH